MRKRRGMHPVVPTRWMTSAERQMARACRTRLQEVIHDTTRDIMECMRLMTAAASRNGSKRALPSKRHAIVVLVLRPRVALCIIGSRWASVAVILAVGHEGYWTSYTHSRLRIVSASVGRWKVGGRHIRWLETEDKK